MGKKIAVIGAGPGGYVAGIRAAQLGAEVTVIEQENVGGTCLNWGCIPSKVMKTAAEMLEGFRRAEELGVELKGTVMANMRTLMARKQTVVKNQTDGVLRLFKRHKIRYLVGKGLIEGPHHAAVKSPEGGVTKVGWDSLILALGSQQVSLPSFPFDGERILSTNDALSLDQIPESILILGGGVMGCEFACIFASLGSRVTVVEALSRLLPLPWVDEDCSKVLEREMKKRKITFMVNRTVEGVEQAEGRCRVAIGRSPFAQMAKEKDITPLIADADKVLICIGRKPTTAGIGLEKLGVELDEAGWIMANERMETNVSDIYGIGDALGPSKVMLAHVASMEGIIAAENAMGESRTMHYDAVPGTVFTMPEVATVGLTETQATDQGYPVRSDTVLFRNLGKAHVLGEIAGQVKLVSDRESGRILGIHIVGPHASDLIAEATLAMHLGCTVQGLAETMHAHPTLAEIMLEASFKALDKPLHG